MAQAENRLPSPEIQNTDVEETEKVKMQHPPLKKTVPAAERKAQAIQRLQMAYRVHLAMRQYRRKQKLKVFADETSAAIVIQCLFRKKEAEKRVARKRALAHFAKFMSTLRPSLQGSGLNEEEMLAYAAIKVQAAWRRRQAYFARVRAKNRKGFYKLVKQKRQGQAISEAEIEDLAATFIQAKFRGRKGYFEGMRRREAMRQRKRQQAAVRMQAWFRGIDTRARVRREANERKMKRLAGFFSNVCYMKCFLIWGHFADQQRHMKEVLGKVMVRLTKRGMFMGFLMLKSYAASKKEKREALRKAAAHLFGSKHHARDEAFFAWHDLLRMDEETNRKVAEKMAKFLGLGAAAMRRSCFDGWAELAKKKRKALWKWKNSVLVRAWHEYKEVVQAQASNSKLLGRVRNRWLNWSVVAGLARWRLAVEDRKWARHVIVHAIWRFSMRDQALPFEALLEHKTLSQKERAIKERFKLRFKMRACHLMLLAWRDDAAEEARRREIIGKARFRLQNQAVVGCLAEWKGLVQDRKIEAREQLAQGSAALMRWIKRPMVDGFHAWVELIHKLKIQRERGRKLMWRIKNAAVVSTWERWLDWLVQLSMRRRETLSAAVKAALVAGSLMDLLQMARSQPKAYREMLQEVMQEHFSSEAAMVASLAAPGPAKGPRKRGPPDHAGVSQAQVQFTKEALRAMWEPNLDDSAEGPAPLRHEDSEAAAHRSGHSSPAHSSRGASAHSPLHVARIPPGQFVLPPDTRSPPIPPSPPLRAIAEPDAGPPAPASEASRDHASFLDSDPLHASALFDDPNTRPRQPGPAGTGTGTSTFNLKSGPHVTAPSAMGGVPGMPVAGGSRRGGADRDSSLKVRRGGGAHAGGGGGGAAGRKGDVGRGGRSDKVKGGERQRPPAGPQPVAASAGGMRQILPAYLQAVAGGGEGGRPYGRAAGLGTSTTGAGRKGRGGGKGGRHRVEEIEGVLRESIDDLEGLGRGGAGSGMEGAGRGGEPGRPRSEGSMAVGMEGGGAGGGGEGVDGGGEWGHDGGPVAPVMIDEWDQAAVPPPGWQGGRSMAEVSATIDVFERKARGGGGRGGSRAGGTKGGKGGKIGRSEGQGQGHRDVDARGGGIPMPELDSDEEEKEGEGRQGGAGAEGPTRLPAIVQRGDIVHLSAEQAWGSGKFDSAGRPQDGAAGAVVEGGLPDRGVELPALQQTVF